MDIGSHVIAEQGFREPEDNKDIFVILNEEGLVPDNFLENLINMAKFRNILVHDYMRIDPEIVYTVLKNNLGDFDRFSKLIVGWIESLRDE